MTQVSAIRGPGGAVTHMLYMTQDISERKRMEERLREISITDELTGLVNRRGFIMLADQSLKAATREGRCRYLLFVDMDNMKLINDTLGHAEGDRALVEVGEVLKATYRRSDIVGRLGGDEFAVLVQCGPSEEGEDTVIRRLEDAVERANAREDRAFTLTVSAGVTRYDPDDPPEVGPLLSRADSLMYEVKRAKKERRG
jgi:diguanylate cyclase (GGDEF)-like protein